MKKTKPATLKLIENHDWISLVAPNGRFTLGRYSTKASGGLASNQEAFDKLTHFVLTESTKGVSFGITMQLLTNPVVLEKYWPEWAKERTKPDIKINEIVKCKGEWYGMLGCGHVVAVKRNGIHIKTPKGVFEIPFENIEKTGAFKK